MIVVKGILYLGFLWALASPCWGENSPQTRDLNFYQSRNWFELGREQTKHYQYLLKKEKKLHDGFNMKLAKQSLISGDFERARTYLNRVRDDSPYFKAIKRRYLAIMAFLQKDYRASLQHLSLPDFNEFSNYRHVCLLKLLNYTALNEKKQYGQDLQLCKQSILADQQNGANFFWLDQYYLLTTDRDQILSPGYMSKIKNLSDDDLYLTKWLKLALFLNQEEAILELVPKLPKEAYESQKNRELIGFAYYRRGNKQMAQDFIEDIESPNADNMRGNISLDEGRFELAFGHFQLALKKKENSINALERSLPLAWQLGQWKEAQKLLSKLHHEHIDEKKKLALKAALHMRSQEFDQADRDLHLLKAQYKRKNPIEIDIMSSYVALRQYDNDKLIQASDDACHKYDGLNCYLLLQTLSWHNVGALTKRLDTPFTMGQGFSVHKLKEQVPIDPLKEARYIDQRDIEELDSRAIQIKPSDS